MRLVIIALLLAVALGCMLAYAASLMLEAVSP